MSPESSPWSSPVQSSPESRFCKGTFLLYSYNQRSSLCKSLEVAMHCGIATIIPYHLQPSLYALRGSTALWFEHWPGDRKVPGSMPSAISCCCCCFLEQGTLLSLLQSTQLYKWANLSHRYCEEFDDHLGDLSRRSSTRFRETSLERGLP